MFLRNLGLVAILTLLLVGFACPVYGQQPARVIYGDIVQVHTEEQKIMLEVSGQKSILLVEPDCVILRFGKETALASLRPISPEFYQDALCLLNSRGTVDCILVNYCFVEEDGLLVNYDIFGNPKEIRRKTLVVGE